ncbi:MAG: peptidase S8 [Planctomycetota bacterium]|nr:MAG: peptidase S8 [Planctomycetota bacterium]
MLLLTSTLALTSLLAPMQQPADSVSSFHANQVVAETWTTPLADGTLQDWYRLSLDDGKTFSRDRATHYHLQLRYGVFDPVREAHPEMEKEFHANATDNQLWIVQYITQGAETWREELRGLGGVDHRYLGMHANIWQMSAEVAAEVATKPYVRWVGAFHPAYKLENAMLDAYRAGGFETTRYNVIVGARGMSQKTPVADLIRELGGEVHVAEPGGFALSATMNAEQVMQILHHPMVLGIDRWGGAETDMNIVRNVMGATYLEGVAGYTGQGVRAEVMDSGLDTSHADWATPPLIHNSAPSAAHGTCTYGINFASGASSAGGQSRGVIPDATGIFAEYFNYVSRHAHTAELVNPALPYRAVFQTNSWGGGRTFFYNSDSQEMDDMIFINDISILQSQSNAGNQDSRGQAWAKNVISVGGIRHGNNNNDADDNWSFGGSIGPADDGRIKPDLAAYYDNVWTSDADPGGYVGGDDYQSFSGTSAATPIVAGFLGLVYQMWSEGDFGNPVGAGDVFDNRPHNTTAKALLINSARQWNFAGANHDLTRVHQGWGKPDVRRAYDNGGQTFVIDETEVLGNLESAMWTVTVPSGADEFRATMVYTDPAGTTSANLHRINDLSLKVTDPGGLVYWGNNGLLAAMTSSSGGTSNTLDTVEQVIVASPAAGTWTVEVFADEVNQDTHLETGAVDCDFALVVTPVTSFGGGDPLDTIVLTGPANPATGVPVAYDFSNAAASTTVYLLASANLNGLVFGGHNFDLGNPVQVGATTTSDGVGSGSFSVTIPVQYAGGTYFLEAAALDAGTWTESAALQVNVQ